MPLARVPQQYFHRLVDKARAEGCDIDGLLAELQIDAADWNHHHGMSAFTYGQLYQRIMRETGNEFFGLFSDGKVPLGAFRLMCLSLLSCRDFRQAVVRSGEFADSCRGMVARFLIECEGGKAILSLGPIRSVSQDTFDQLLASFEQARLVCTLHASYRFHCWLVGRPIPLRQLSLTCSLEEAQLDTALFAADRVVFNSRVNQIIYDESALRLPVVQTEDSIREFLRTAPYHLIAPDPMQVSLADQVRAILNRDVGRSMPSAEDVSQQLNVSVPTLRRRLMQQGVSYQALKDQVRLEAALHYLTCPDLSNTEVAERLGFDEPSAFFRAFKKWTGQTPGVYRRRILGQD